jgi:hypothetical protein
MAQGCRLRPVTDVTEWDPLFFRVEHPQMNQAWAYGEARQAAGAGWRKERRLLDLGGWQARRLVFEREGDPVAICQLFEKSLGVAYATRISRGPLFLGVGPSADAVEDVYRALRRRFRHLRRGVLSLAPALAADADNHRLLAGLGFRDSHIRGQRSSLIDLRQDEEQLLRKLRSTWRNRLRSAQRSDLVLSVAQSPDDFDWIVDRHAANMLEKGFSGPPPALVNALYRAAANDVLVYRGLLGEESVAGMLVFRYGRAAAYYIGWMGNEGRKVNVANFMYWEIALDLKRRGCQWFDLGGYAAAGVDQFKRGMGGEDYELLNSWMAF